ncbi:MAG TPA: ABC transporter ATP-binding protein [Acidimicrobiia bacterium]|nr:ABC transporter ATP-binding protein [Acidimicrobiia bacterium]
MRVLTQGTGLGIDVEGLTHTYGSGPDALVVLDHLDVSIAPGEYVAVTGRSGAGKSTFLAILGGLERQQSGRVVVGDVDLGALDGDALASYRRDRVGFVFQHYGLLGSMTAAENVELAMTFAGVSRARRRARASELLDAVGVGARAGHRPSELSGGESQRVAMARALANEPRLVLADEPTGNLDDDSTVLVLDLLERLPSEHGCTLVVVTHNHLVAEHADRRLVLAGGRLVTPRGT